MSSVMKSVSPSVRVVIPKKRFLFSETVIPSRSNENSDQEKGKVEK